MAEASTPSAATLPVQYRDGQDARQTALLVWTLLIATGLGVLCLLTRVLAEVGLGNFLQRAIGTLAQGGSSFFGVVLAVPISIAPAFLAGAAVSPFVIVCLWCKPRRAALLCMAAPALIVGPIATHFVGLTEGPFIGLGAMVLGCIAGARRLPNEYREDSACSNCGYDLTGNATGACPECGASKAP